ncbi:hypothetical protein Patl1_05617 [Pistacia atlantica]|uniref:Uncharacterized protein n=1 Tax=Pistacia atlantica TaxID=434234 RepID=A0ACC1BSI0_9ROSI|nr:hypothetical protein Patl1_05617 [Pistacia atlantica]
MITMKLSLRLFLKSLMTLWPLIAFIREGQFLKIQNYFHYSRKLWRIGPLPARSVSLYLGTLVRISSWSLKGSNARLLHYQKDLLHLGVFITQNQLQLTY